MRGGSARRATNAIIEARYTFHQFRSIEELFQIMKYAAERMSEVSGEQSQTIALRLITQVRR